MWACVLEKADAAWRSQLQTHVVIGFWCKAGRHRSVATASMFVRSLEGTGMELVAFQHLSAHNWFLRTCMYEQCAECTNEQDRRKVAAHAAAEAAKQRVFRAWHSSA